MTEPAEDAWFFSREGEQSGPLTYGDLKEKADEGVLNPRLDLVWKQGMPDWKPIGEIEGLFDRRVPPAPGPTIVDPRLPVEESEAASNAFLGTFPGARRRVFLFALILFPILWGLVLGLAKYAAGDAVSPAMMEKIMLGAGIFPLIVGIYYSLERLANLGMSRWWYLGNFVPLLNLWIGYRSVACPAGYAVHKKMDGIGVFLAILYWLVALAAILAIAAVVAAMFGALGDPEIQQKIKDAIGPILEQAKAKAEALPKK